MNAKVMFDAKAPINPITQQLNAEWEKFMLAEPFRRSGDDSYRDIFNNGWLFPLQRVNETAAMIRLARELKPRVVMEIGSDKGGGFYHWIKGLPSVKRAVAIEYSGVPFASAFERMFPEVDFHFIHASSYELATVESVRHFLAEDKFDCIFIDGDKGRTRDDFEAYVSMVRPGGLIFIHDVEQSIYKGAVPNPSEAFYELRKRYKLSVILDGREGMDAETRERGGEVPTSSYETWLRTWKWNSCGVGIVHI